MTIRKRTCGSPEHVVDRRLFLQGGLASALGVSLAGFGSPLHSLMAGEVKKKAKRVILLWLAGGASQLETWDPKPGRPTGGPFRAIDTSVPGIRISELMPQLAQRQQHTALIRSLNTKNADHGGGTDLME